MNITTPLLQRLVGLWLRRFREGAGFSLHDVAGILECDPSKISRIETGQRGIRIKELRELLAEYAVDTALGEALITLARRQRGSEWRTEYAGALSDEYLDFLAAETSASATAIYAPVQIPELLQIPEYARAVIAADASLPVDTEPAVAAAILDRQRAVFREDGPRLTVVIGEAALRLQAGGQGTMRDQYGRLADLAESCAQVSIRILPFTAGPPAVGAAGGFSVLQFGRLPVIGLLHLAGPGGGTCPDAPGAVDSYLRAFACLQDQSLDEASSARRLRQLA